MNVNVKSMVQRLFMPIFEFLSQPIAFLHCFKIKNSRKYWVSLFKVFVWHCTVGLAFWGSNLLHVNNGWCKILIWKKNWKSTLAEFFLDLTLTMFRTLHYVNISAFLIFMALLWFQWSVSLFAGRKYTNILIFKCKLCIQMTIQIANQCILSTTILLVKLIHLI